MNHIFRIKKRLKYANLEKKKFLFDKIINTKIDVNSTVFDKWTYALASHFIKHGKKSYAYKKIKNELINFYTDFINQKSIFWIIAFNESHKRPDYMFRVFQQKFIYNNNWGFNKFFQNKKFKNNKKESNKKFKIYEYDNIKKYKNNHIKHYYDFSRFVSHFFSKKIYKKMIFFSKEYSWKKKDYKIKKVYKIKKYFFNNESVERVSFKKFFNKFKKNNKNVFFFNVVNRDENKKISFKTIKEKKLFFKKEFSTKKHFFKKIKAKTIKKIKKISRNKKYIKFNDKKIFFLKPKKYIFYFFKKNNTFKWIKKNDYFTFYSKFIFIKINKFACWNKSSKIQLFKKIGSFIKSNLNRDNIVYWHFFFSKLNKKKIVKNHRKKIVFKQSNISNKINYMYKKFDKFFFWKKKNKKIKNKIFKIVPNNKVKYKVKQIMIPELGKFLLVERKYKNVSYKNFFIDFIKLVSPSIKIFKQQRNRGTAYYVYYGRKVPDFYEHQKSVFNLFKDLVNKNENYNHLVRNPKKPKKKIISIKPKKSKRVNTTFSERFYSEFNKFINFEGDVFSKFDEYGRVFQKKKSNKHYRWELKLNNCRHTFLKKQCVILH